jgi:hypothetical protein
VHVTASTNSGAIDVAVYSDGSAERTTGAPRYNDASTLTPDPKSYPPASPDVLSFLCDLAAAGPVSAIPTTSCPKSVSFGTEMTIAVGADTSGDLECLAATASPAATALAHDCDVLTGRRN